MMRKFECHAEEAGEWEREVMDNWFESEEDSPPLLARANKYLGERVSVRDMLGQAIVTHSYCAFLVVSKLTAMLFFEDLAAQKRHANALQVPPPHHKVVYVHLLLLVRSHARMAPGVRRCYRFGLTLVLDGRARNSPSEASGSSCRATGRSSASRRATFPLGAA